MAKQNTATVTSRDAALDGIASLLQRQPSATTRELAEEAARIHPQFTSRQISVRVLELIAEHWLIAAGERKCSFTGMTCNVYARA